MINYKGEIMELSDYVEALEAEVKALRAELSLERDTVNFYANSLHWLGSYHSKTFEDATVDEVITAIDLEVYNDVTTGGRLARQRKNERKEV